MGVSSSKDAPSGDQGSNSNTATATSSPSSTNSIRVSAKLLAPKAISADVALSLECPICLVNYMYVNTTNCCSQWICTNCVELLTKKNICPYCNQEPFRVTYDSKKNVDLLNQSLANPLLQQRNSKTDIVIVKSSVADRRDIEQNVASIVKETSGQNAKSGGRPGSAGSASKKVSSPSSFLTTPIGTNKGGGGGGRVTATSPTSPTTTKNINSMASNTSSGSKKTNSSSKKPFNAAGTGEVEYEDLLAKFLKDAEQQGLDFASLLTQSASYSSASISTKSPTSSSSTSSLLNSVPSGDKSKQGEMSMIEIDDLEDKQLQEAIRLSMIVVQEEPVAKSGGGILTSTSTSTSTPIFPPIPPAPGDLDRSSTKSNTGSTMSSCNSSSNSSDSSSTNGDSITNHQYDAGGGSDSSEFQEIILSSSRPLLEEKNPTAKLSLKIESRNPDILKCHEEDQETLALAIALSLTPTSAESVSNSSINSTNDNNDDNNKSQI